jgi:hypothetical protein
MSKANDPNDKSVDASSMLGAATGQQGTDWMGMAQSAMADGKLDMGDLMRVFSGQKGQPAQGNQQSSGGGLGDMLGGLFGK